MSDPVDAALLRELTPAVLTVLVRRGADFATAEDAVQEALLTAVQTWPDDPPRDPKGWLVTVGWRKFLDLTRSDTARRGREERIQHEPEPGPVAATDDTLELYLRCAHPALSPASAVALTLRAVGGLTTRQIAAAYLVPEATMAQRISRAKRTVADVRFDQAGDLSTVLTTLYLVFNEGYSGDVDLVAEAIRLTRELARLVAAERSGRARGRRPAGSDAAPPRPSRGPDRRARGRLIPLADQDRPRWRTGPDRRGCRPAAGRLGLATGSVRTRRRRRSRPCTPTPRPPWRPTGCRSSSWYDELLA